MRVIEKKMVKAVTNKGKMSTTNTKVETLNEVTKVTLHGNMIAEIDWSEKLMFLSNCGWQTPTTKSRLNAILDALKPGFYIYQKKGTWYISTPESTGQFDKSQVISL
jgi:hypothetical protein